MHNDLIIYIDKFIIAVNKPPGLRTIPDGYDQSKENLQFLLKKEFPELMTIHRLDKETSGVLIFARDRVTHRSLNIQFEKRKIQKKYWLIVHNIPDWQQFSANLPLLLNGDRRHRTIVNQVGKPSETEFFQRKSDHQKCLSLLEAIPLSGYTHQIRSHISYLGFPILGDFLYSKGLSVSQLQLNDQAGRMMLHAASIEFTHPDTHQQLIITTDVPFSLDDI